MKVLNRVGAHLQTTVKDTANQYHIIMPLGEDAPWDKVKGWVDDLAVEGVTNARIMEDQTTIIIWVPTLARALEVASCIKTVQIIHHFREAPEGTIRIIHEKPKFPKHQHPRG